MGKDSLPLVFGAGDLQYIPARKWYESIISNKEVYGNCFVPSFTRVKNLGSKYMHEYCQFIVEDRSTGERGRVYAERMNEKAIDVVTIGRDEKASRKQDELPLPLTSVAFDDKAKQPSLFEVATVINSVSVVGGKYNFYDKNCFWFAFTTFDTVRLAFSGTLKNWLWVNPGGRGGGSIGDAWGLGFPTMFKYFFKSAAEDFEKERRERTTWIQPADERDQITPDEYITMLNGHLLNPQAVAAYGEWSRAAGEEFTKEDLEQITSNVEIKVKELDAQGAITWTSDFDTAVVDLTNKVLSEANVDEYLAKYNAQPRTGYIDVDADIDIGMLKATDAVNGEEVTKPSDTKLRLKTKANEDLVKALRVMVGEVLVDAGLGN